jgi:hypothetical protein
MRKTSVWLNTDMEMSYAPTDSFGINITGNSEIFISVPDISKVKNMTYFGVGISYLVTVQIY